MSPPGTEPRLVLASRSARRRALLHEHGVPHEAIDPGVDDAGLAPGRVPPAAWAAALAYLKARAGAEALRRAGRAAGALLLGADTICVLGGRLFGQARTADEAREALTAFENREHEVVTGVALWESGTGRREVFAERALVRWGAVGRDRIDEYVRSGQWRGKAGSYNLAERVAAGWPIACEGDWTGVVGLPMRRLAARLRHWLPAAARAAGPESCVVPAPGGAGTGAPGPLAPPPGLAAGAPA